VLKSAHSPPALYTSECPNTSIYLIVALSAPLLLLMQIAWTTMAFHAYRLYNPLILAQHVLLHLLFSLSTLATYFNNSCFITLLVQLVTAVLSLYLAANLDNISPSKLKVR